MLNISFEDDGFLVVKNIVNVDELSSYIETKTKSPTPDMKTDTAVPDSLITYKDIKTEELLEKIKPIIEKETNLKLFKTYSFWRKYFKGQSLRMHSDRNACEITVSICVSYKGKTPWKIWLADFHDEVHGVELEVGDAIIFRGHELLHWRDKLENDEQTQVFLHYVDRYGKNYMLKDDKNKQYESTLPFKLYNKRFTKGKEFSEDFLIEYARKYFNQT